MSSDNLSLSEKLRELRTKCGYTQKYIGDYLNITRQGYAHYENGGRTPDNQTLLQLAALYNLSIEELINNSLIPSTLHEETSYSTYDCFKNNKTKNTIQPSNSIEENLLQYFRQLPPNIQVDILEYVKYRLFKSPKK